MLRVVCKLAKIWFIMQCTLSQKKKNNKKSSFYFFLQEIFFIGSFTAKSRVCFCRAVVPGAGLSCCVAVCPSSCFLPEPRLERCGSGSGGHGPAWRGAGGAGGQRSAPGRPGPRRCLCCFWGEPGRGLGGDKTKGTLVCQECVRGVKGIYLTMKHGNKCAYIEQCEYVSYRYSTSKGRASPKPKRVNMNLYFLKNVKCEIMVFA